jgi:hypothetical protein
VNKRKRRGSIALEAAYPMTTAAQAMDDETEGIFVRNIQRWLDNGHNLDASDIEWLAQESRDAAEGRRFARLAAEPELPCLTVTEQEDGTWATFQDGHELWAWPTLNHAVSSLRSFLLREFAPRS